MQMRIHFLKFPDFLCMGPRMMTPMIPDITGLPPTQPTAIAKLSWNQGLRRKDRIIDKPLNIPK